MAIHDTPAAMLKESLPESLKAAKYCIEYRKDNEEWGKFNTGGCLGYPGTILLFSIVDSIGSYFRKCPTFKININGKQTAINSEGYQHLFILNSSYFNLTLSEDFIKALYSKFRSCLTHNNVLGDYAVLMQNDLDIPTEHKNKPFIELTNQKGEIAHIIVINKFYELVECAVEKFIIDIDKIVPFSKQGKKFH